MNIWINLIDGGNVQFWKAFCSCYFCSKANMYKIGRQNNMNTDMLYQVFTLFCLEQFTKTLEKYRTTKL